MKLRWGILKEQRLSELGNVEHELGGIMTSDKVKTMLRQMADFHGAIVYAAQILEAVEAAEHAKKTLVKDIAVKEQRLSELGNVEHEWRDKKTQAEKDFELFVTELNRRREQMSKGLDGVKQQIGDAEQALREVMMDKEKTIADLNGVIVERRKTLEKVQGEIDRLRKAFVPAA